MKKFEQLGRSLSKEELKKIKGGTDAPPADSCDCNSIDDCSNGQHCYNTGCTRGTYAGKCQDKLA